VILIKSRSSWVWLLMRARAEVVMKTSEVVENVVVVDDGSVDGTFNVASLDGTIPVIKHPYNIGVGATIRIGITHALKTKPDIVVMLDADGQHNPEEIPSLLEPILKRKSQLIVGRRDFSEMSLPRRLSNTLTAKILNQTWNVNLADVQCGFRAVRTDVLRSLKIRENGYPWACEMLINAQRLGVKMSSVHVETIRGDKSSVKPLRDTLCFLRMLSRQKGRENNENTKRV